MELKVATNIKYVQSELKKYEQGMIRAEVSANKKVAAQVKTAISKDARQKYNLKVATVNKFVKVGRGKGRTAVIKISSRGIGLGNYGAIQKREGVSVKVIKPRGRKVIKSAFIQTMASGHVGVFVRKVIGGSKVGRYPIKYLYGPSAREIFKIKNTLPLVKKIVAEKLPKIYANAVEFYNKNNFNSYGKLLK